MKLLGSRWSIAIGGATGLGVVWWNAEAVACSQPLPDLVHVAPAVPQGGLILGQLQCKDCTADDLGFRTEAGEVAGSFVATGLDDPSFFAFEPSEPLPVSDADDYQSGLFVSVFERAGRERRVIITAASTAEPEAKGSLSTHSELGGTLHQCEEYSPTTGGLCGQPTYSSHTAVRANLGIEVEHGSQYFYRATYTADDDEVQRLGVLGDFGTHLFEGAPDEVCYVFERIALDGGEISLKEECLSTEEFELGTIDQIFGAPDNTLMFCLEPPDGQEEQWCAYFGEAIAAQDCTGFAQDSCEAALDACDFETTTTGTTDNDTEETTTASGDGDDGGTSTTGDTEGTEDTTSRDGGTGTLENDRETTATDTSSAPDEASGCSMSGPSRLQMSSTWLVLPAALLTVWARRRERSVVEVFRR